MQILNFLETYNGTLMLLATLIIAILTFRNVKELKIAREEENRPYIVFYIQKFEKEKFYFILKNFGKTSGTIKLFEVTPDLEIQKYKPNRDMKFNEACEGLYLAPNQSIVNFFDFKDHSSKRFKILIEYENDNKKVYKSEYVINLDYRDSLSYMTTNYNNPNTPKLLGEIKHSIDILSQRFL